MKHMVSAKQLLEQKSNTIFRWLLVLLLFFFSLSSFPQKSGPIGLKVGGTLISYGGEYGLNYKLNSFGELEISYKNYSKGTNAVSIGFYKYFSKKYCTDIKKNGTLYGGLYYDKMWGGIHVSEEVNGFGNYKLSGNSFLSPTLGWRFRILNMDSKDERGFFRLWEGGLNTFVKYRIGLEDANVEHTGGVFNQDTFNRDLNFVRGGLEIGFSIIVYIGAYD